MEWETLLATQRLSGTKSRHRNEYDDDYKRIVTSPAFRRLQDKTQVFPLERSDFIHTRLTHSLEVAMIGRSLVNEIASLLSEGQMSPSQAQMVDRQADIARIVECASLLHDMGNPPYGHFGEDIIRQWFRKNLSKLLFEYSDHADAFLKSDYAYDFYHFEGNAQALRIVTKLYDFKGKFEGLNLTPATLNTILKYSRAATEPKTDQLTSKKIGFFQAEKDLFEQITQITGTQGARHPLTFILEAADDIAYLVADMEDAIGKGFLRFAVVKSHCLKTLRPVQANYAQKIVKILETIDEKSFSINQFFVDLRNFLIEGATQTFVAHYEEIMAGTYESDLLTTSKVSALYQVLRLIATEEIYDHKNILRLEVSAHTTLTYLLDTFVPPLIAYDTKRPLDYVDQKIIGIISESQKRSYHFFSSGKDPVEKLYLRLMLATDFISGMTDSYAHQLYLDMLGIS